MTQYIKVKDISTTFHIPSHRLIEVLKQMQPYKKYSLDYDFLVRYSDTFYLFNLAKPKKTWTGINDKLKSFILLKEDDIYKTTIIKKATKPKKKSPKNKRTKGPIIQKTAVEVALQKYLKKDFKRGGLTQ